jgi:hypothetical protein
MAVAFVVAAGWFWDGGADSPLETKPGNLWARQAAHVKTTQRRVGPWDHHGKLLRISI